MLGSPKVARVLWGVEHNITGPVQTQSRRPSLRSRGPRGKIGGEPAPWLCTEVP